MPQVCLHSDTEFVVAPDGFLLLDHGTGKCLLLRGEDRYLIHLLQHTESASDACNAFKSRFDKSVSARQIGEFVEQLLDHGMLASDSDEAIPREMIDRAPPPAIEDPFSLFTQGATLNFVFDVLVLLFGWILRPIWLLPLLALMWMAANIIREQGVQLFNEHLMLLGKFDIAFYLAFILVPKHFALSCVEAILTGMVCRRFRGRVRRVGIRMRLGLLPSLQAEYDDSILMLPKRGRRTFMTVGIWSMLAIGSIALIGTTLTTSQSTLHDIWLLLLVPCIVRLAIVCNVYFRYSSLYLLLVDVFGERDLMDDAITEASRWLTFRPPARPSSSRRLFWLRLFGIGYFLYRIVLSITVLWAGWYMSVNNWGLAGGVLTIAAFIYFNHDIFFRKKNVVRRSMPRPERLSSVLAG